MTKDEFVKLCSSGGYCNKKVALLYAGDRTEFTEEDFENAFRYSQKVNPDHRDLGGGKRHTLRNGAKTTKRYKVVN